MSVEDARAAVTTAMIEYGDARAANDGRMIEKPMQPAIDRLILEVQAEMPCCYQDRPLSCLEEQKRSTVHLCPSCTAHMKLKETADAR